MLTSVESRPYIFNTEEGACDYFFVSLKIVAVKLKSI
jgi:hypothetical protein